MTDIEALRARMREAAEKVESCRTSSKMWNLFAEVASPANVKALDAEITRLREDLDRVTRERDGAYLTSQQAAQSYSNLMRVKEDIDAQRQDAEAALAVVTRERDEALEQVEAHKLMQSLDKDSAYVIRKLLNERNVPSAAFIDDHVANAIAQRDAAEAALAKRDEEVARLRGVLEGICEYWNGGAESALDAIQEVERRAAEALTQETPHAE